MICFWNQHLIKYNLIFVIEFLFHAANLLQTNDGSIPRVLLKIARNPFDSNVDTNQIAKYGYHFHIENKK